MNTAAPHGIAADPTTTIGPTTTTGRHQFVDALRGFALLGILLVNVEFILQHPEAGWLAFDSPVDLGARWWITTFGASKIYPIFAALFGYGLALQTRRSGDELWPRYRRRMIVLLALGALHGIFFFPGDILVIYAVVGLFAYRLRNTPTQRLLKIAGWVYGVCAAVFIIVGALDWVDGAPLQPSATPPVFLDGSFLDVAAENLWIWLVTLALLSIVQGPAVVACFAVGNAVGRTDILSNPAVHRALFNRALRLLPAGLLIASFGAWLVLAVPAAELLGFAIGFAVAPIVAAGYIAVLARLCGDQPNRLTRFLAASGRMSLTVYLLESVVTAFLAYGYGVGLMPSVGPLSGLGIAVSVWLGLSLFSLVWMRTFRFGPFEWMLRSVSYGRLQPIRKAT